MNFSPALRPAAVFADIDSRRAKAMKYDRFLILLAGLFFIIGLVKKSDKKTEEKRNQKGEKLFPFLLLIAIC